MKHVKKFAFLSIIIIIMLLIGQSAKAYVDENKKGTTFTIGGGMNEEDWRYNYFCWDHGKEAPRPENKMTYDHSEVYRSDDANVLKKAYILNEAIEAKLASYSRNGYLNKTKYQLALWKELGYGLSANDGNIAEANDLYTNAENFKGIKYSTDSCRCSTGKVIMKGNVGSLKIETLVGNITNIKYNDSNSKLTVYRNEECTDLITKYEYINAGDTIYFKNENAGIRSLQIEAQCAASGYKILAHFYNCSNSSAQRLVKVEKVVGQPSSINISLDVKYTTGNLEIRKQGVTVSNSKIIATEKITATFKLFCTEENKWVVGNPSDMKSYTSNFDNATAYTTADNDQSLVTNIVIKNLESGKHYEIVEIDVGNHAYKKSSGLSEIYSASFINEQANIKISTKSVNNKAYPSVKENDNGIEIKTNETRKVLVKNKKKNGNMTIKKVDYDYNVPLNGAKFAVYCTANGGGWLGYNETKQEVTYGKTWANKYEFITGNSYCGDVKVDGEISIKNLIQGNYVVYEVATPDGYNLKDQPGYLYKDVQSYVEKLNNYGSDDKDAVMIGKESYIRGYVSLKDGTAKRNRLETVNDVVFNTDYGWNNENNSGYTSSNLTYTIKNKKQTKLTINKTDAKDGKKLKDVGIKVLVKLYEKVQYEGNILDVNTWGWLKQDGTVTTKYNEAYEFKTDNSGNIELLNIPYGIYYIYETSSGTGYDLIDQTGYKMSKPKNLNGEFFGENEEYVFLGSKTINKPEYIPEIKNGIYKISSKINSDMVLEIPSSYVKEEVRIQTFADNKTIGQMFMIEYVGEGYYTIRSLISGKYLDVMNGQVFNCAEVIQYRNNGSDAQLWRFSKQEDGSYSITSKIDNRYCIDIPGAKDESNLQIQMYLRNDTPAQKFNFLRQDGTNGQTNEEAKMNVKEGLYEIHSNYKPENYDFALDISGNSAEDGANLRLFQANHTDAQKFNIIYVGGGNYIIQKKYTEGKTITYKVLTVADKQTTQDSTTLNTRNIYQMPYEIKDNYYDFNGNKWKFKYDEEKKCYYIVSKMTKVVNNQTLEFSIDITGGTSNIDKAKNAIKNNTPDKWVNIQLYQKNNTKAQEFLLNKVDNSNIQYGNREETIEVNNKKSEGSITITKQDSDTKEKLVGTEFKLYATNLNTNIIAGGKGWVTLNNGQIGYSTDYNNANAFTTNNEGTVLVENLSYGTYYIYETKAPTGYNIKEQDSYHVQQEGSTTIPQDQDWVALGNGQISNQNKEVKVTLNNQKYTKINGFVWLDNPDRKNNAYNNIYDEQDWKLPGQTNSENSNVTKDKLISGITVNLYSNKNELISTTKTGENGEYEFVRKTNGEKIKYIELQNSYVEFMYDNTKYVVADSFVGNNAKINSKAIEEVMTKEELEDEKLTGTEGNVPGRAVTYKGGNNSSANTLTAYYNSETYAIEDINLGLKDKHNPTFDVSENLEYVKVQINGYTYKYQHGPNAGKVREYVPGVATQIAGNVFSQILYPSDIAYRAEDVNKELSVYVVYSIAVTNNDISTIDDIYNEQKLYLNSLVNNYDNERYELCTDENTEDSADFRLWKNGENYAVYDIENGKYKNGIASGETITSYIQFKINKEHLRNMLERTSEATEHLENAPTVAKASGYHEYLRTDNVWNEENSVKVFDGKKGNYNEKNTANETYFVHKSLPVEDSSSNVFIDIIFGDNRTISGVVFEDKDENTTDAERLGNGKFDNGETKIKDVVVSLLNETGNVTKVYPTTNYKTVEQNAITINKEDGTYEIVGMVPGKYYLQFTYGNGKTKYTDLDGKEISIATSKVDNNTVINPKLYKSTILTGNAKNANDEKWFLNDIGQNNSVATDLDNVINSRIGSDPNANNLNTELNYKYVENSDANGIINAKSPKIDINIEKADSKEGAYNDIAPKNCSRLSFGIIERPHVNIELEKIQKIKMYHLI